MTSGRLIDVDGRPALHFERSLPHPVDRVWRAVTEPAELSQWFVGAVAWTPALGETRDVAGRQMVITELDPPRRIAWDWGDEWYAFDLAVSPEGCVLEFTHVFDDRFGPAAQHAAGWEAYLGRLDALLAGHPIDEIEAHVSIAEHHEQYAVAFGQDPTPGRRMIAGLHFRDLTLEPGPQLRLERQYRHSVDRVWRAIADPAEQVHWFPDGAESLTVTESEPPTRLVGTWHGGTLSFTLTPEPGGCRLVFTHAFDDRDLAAMTGAGWHRCFARVDALLADHPMDDRASLDAWTDVHERYAEQWGVDPEIGRRALAEHPVGAELAAETSR
jgi:uncharacterized protein YndB with AHSA1/START domain